MYHISPTVDSDNTRTIELYHAKCAVMPTHALDCEPSLKRAGAFWCWLCNGTRPQTRTVCKSVLEMPGRTLIVTHGCRSHISDTLDRGT